MGALATQHNGENIVPLALSFAKVFKIQFWLYPFVFLW
jgi:hypothetical protein